MSKYIRSVKTGTNSISLCELPLDELIFPSVLRVRDNDLLPLAKSISQLGMLEPVTVRKRGELFEVICGQRRVRAAAFAGLRSVPCIVKELSDSGMYTAYLSSLIHHDEPDVFETAALLGTFCSEFRFDEQQAAVLLGVPREFITDKLSLLRLTSVQRSLMSEYGLTEEHAHILLSQFPSDRNLLIDTAIKKGYSPRELRRYIKSVSDEERKRRSYRRRARVLSDRRLFFNTIERAVNVMRLAGVDISAERTSHNGITEYVIRLPDKS